MESHNSESSVETALENLNQIKAGEDPRGGVVRDDVTVFGRDELDYWNDSVVRDREQIYEDFVRAVNVVEPEHPHYGDPYPITIDDLDTSYCRSDSSYQARCGPRGRWSDWIVGFSVDKTAVGKMVRERYYTLLVHELTHVTEGSHSEGSTHNPTFWETMVDNAVRFLEEWSSPVDVDEFVSYCRWDPNKSMTDRRMMTADEQRQAVGGRILRQL